MLWIGAEDTAGYKEVNENLSAPQAQLSEDNRPKTVSK